MDYPNTTVGRAITDYSPAETTAGEKPLTLAITDSQDGALSVANEARARLITLKDRLFGSPPQPLGNDPKAMPGYSCFSDAARSKGATLMGVLHEIDNLSAEIANRL